MWNWLYRLGAPERSYRLCQRWSSVFLGLFVLLFPLAAYWGLFVAPADYQQGDAFRIMYLHVPAAMLSLGLYGLMTAAVVMYFVWRIQVANWLAEIIAPLGALMTFITLLTGSLWGRPTWGTYWIWDARLTSELILLFIYLGIMAMRQSIPDRRLAGKASGIVTCVGLVNLPIIHYSVNWWHTLHQGSTILQFAKPKIAPEMLTPLLLMIAAYLGFVGYCICQRLARTILAEKKDTKWVQEIKA